MFGVRTVVVPMDFSSCSLAALEHAAALAATTGGTVHLLHVVKPVATGLGGIEAVPADVIGRFRERLRLLAEAARPRGPRTATYVCSGSVDDEIIRYATESRADLIVMGTHGRSGWGHVSLGGTTERVVRRSVCPVLTVRERRATSRHKPSAMTVEVPVA